MATTRFTQKQVGEQQVYIIRQRDDLPLVLFECVAFFIVSIGIGQPPSALLLLQATFIYAAASLFGAVSMLPGGLGATEGGMALLLQQIVLVAREDSVAATLIVRLCTLWFAVLLGVVALAVLGIPKKIETQPE